MPGEKHRLLYPRPFKRADGSEGTEWIQVGVAWMGEKGADIIMYACPVGVNTPDGGIKMITRIDDREQQRGQQRGQQQDSLGPRSGGPQHYERRQREPGDDDENGRIPF